MCCPEFFENDKPKSISIVDGTRSILPLATSCAHSLNLLACWNLLRFRSFLEKISPWNFSRNLGLFKCALADKIPFIILLSVSGGDSECQITKLPEKIAKSRLKISNVQQHVWDLKSINETELIKSDMLIKGENKFLILFSAYANYFSEKTFALHHRQKQIVRRGTLLILVNSSANIDLIVKYSKNNILTCSIWFRGKSATLTTSRSLQMLIFSAWKKCSLILSAPLW